MNKRFEAFAAQLRQMRRQFAEHVATAPAAGNVILHYTSADDPAFVRFASSFITSAAAVSELSTIYTIHIDNWFGPRWLGFCGKFRGIAGVRNRTLKKSLSVPPFHPNRVLSARGHRLRDDGLYADAEDLTSLHPHARSETNINRGIRGGVLHAWYSGKTVDSGKGVVMMYHRKGDKCKAFYTMFNRERGWKLDEHVGITRSEVSSLTEQGGTDSRTSVPVVQEPRERAY